jgi:peptidoglycan hydrolase-like protein with peptidoglycan-binding domain
MKNNIKVASFALVPMFALSAGLTGTAAIPSWIQSTPVAQEASMPVACTSLTENLFFGLSDATSNGEVSKLQTFLQSQGDLTYNLQLGRFGVRTLRAVQQFQASQNIMTSGFVGPKTRAAIQSVSCGTTPPPVSGLNIQYLAPQSGAVGSTVTIYGSGFTNDNTVHFGSGVVMHVPSYNGTSISFTAPSALEPLCYFSEPRCAMPARQVTPGVYGVSVQNSNGTSNSIQFTVTSEQTSGNVTIQSITPASGPVGTTVTLTGRFFDNNNTVHFGNGAIPNVPISSSVAIACTNDPSCVGGIRQTIKFTVPDSVGPNCAPPRMCPMYLQQVTPGTYKVWVENANGSSNTVTFTVTGTTQNQNISITGIDSPSQLALNQSGTWTLHASLGASGSSLHYSVTWGDEIYPVQGIMAPHETNVSTSATFTHAYSRSGTYTQTFTVSDDYGHSATVSTKIVVTPTY